ncbi:hypothetical protein ACWEQL_35100 [Kitasatospora sp. NPDC004240]
MLLTGCVEDTAGQTTAPAPAASSPTPAPFDVAEALKAAGTDPYSAQVEATTYLGNEVQTTQTGRINFNAPDLGTSRLRSGPAVPPDHAVDEEVTSLADAIYTRNLVAGADHRWRRLPGASRKRTDLTAYARLLLDQGPGAHKGVEQQYGQPTQHLAGVITLEQIETLDPQTYRALSELKGKQIECEVWVDASGRIVRAENVIMVPSVLKKVRNVTLVSDFGPRYPCRPRSSTEAWSLRALTMLVPRQTRHRRGRNRDAAFGDLDHGLFTSTAGQGRSEGSEDRFPDRQ